MEEEVKTEGVFGAEEVFSGGSALVFEEMDSGG
jgi:hypothetical protein